MKAALRFQEITALGKEIVWHITPPVEPHLGGFTLHFMDGLRKINK